MDREYLNLIKRLRDIELETLEKDLSKYSKKDLLKLRSEVRSLFIEIGGKSHVESFGSTDLRIENALETLSGKKRFRIQIAISTVIILIGSANLIKSFF